MKTYEEYGEPMELKQEMFEDELSPNSIEPKCTYVYDMYVRDKVLSSKMQEECPFAVS